jgi:Protein of unknown function (DUF2934)
MLATQPVDPGNLAPSQRSTSEGQGREAMIRKAAYLLAQWRGLRPRPEPEDWLTAARQIDELLRICRAALDARSGARTVADILRSQSART